MFKFGFSDESKEDENESGNKHQTQLSWIPCTEIATPDNPKDIVDRRDVYTFTSGDCILSYVPSDNASQLILKDVKELEHSDLLPAKYEGGLKIWESTTDLIDFLQLPSSNIDFSGKLVLDLGCGAGLIGIFALQKGAEVHFQDYNDAVITALTIPNVWLNTSDDCQALSLSCRYFAGDWESFASLVGDQKYDYILTSETIYNSDNHLKIHSVIKNTLKKTGVTFLAAKTNYFGVGGGVRQFEEVLRTNDILQSSVIWKHSQGVQREILRITFKATENS